MAKKSKPEADFPNESPEKTKGTSALVPKKTQAPAKSSTSAPTKAAPAQAKVAASKAKSKSAPEVEVEPESQTEPEAVVTACVVMLEGVVMRSGGGFYEVDVPEEEERLLCSLGGRLKKGKRAWAQPVAVGDRVRVRPLETSGKNVHGQEWREGFIEELLPRTSQLGRSRFNKTAQITLANLDQVVVVMAAREPDINLHRLDRFLVLAEANHLRAVVCFNKTDLLDKKELKSELEPMAQLYRDLGYPVILTSALPEEDKGRKTLQKELKNRISAFIGSSGVGKSSLAMMIDPELQLWVSDVMDIGKGRHTTTDVTLHPLEKGGYIADTPGIKTVALLETTEINLSECFPEMRERESKCKFANCTHRSEPECVVKAAVEKGKIAASRYESYVRLFEEKEAIPTRYPKKDEDKD